MPLARIYQPAKTAMQSGKAKDAWVLEFVAEKPLFTDNLMGWTGMSETLPNEVRLKFASDADAVAYAQKHGIPYEIERPNPAHFVPKAYADNFSFKKIRRHP